MKKLNMKSSIALLAVLTCVSSAHAESITIKGSTTVLPVAQACAEVYMDENPSVDISVQGGGSGVGIASIVDGTCDIGNASRSIKDKELEKAVENGSNPKAHVVAMDGIAVILHPSNSINSFTKKEVKDIYTGKVSKWPNGSEIVVVSRDTSSGTYEAFNKLALNKAKVRPDALLQASNNAVAATVSKTPGAIGYVGLGFITDKVKAVTIDNVMPSKETVLANSYAYSRPLFMYTNGEPKGMVKDFIDFVKSEKGQALAEENGYVGIR